MLRRTVGFTQAAAAAAASSSAPNAGSAKKGDGQSGKGKTSNTEARQRDAASPPSSSSSSSSGPAVTRPRMKPLLGYPIRRAAAAEMLYGGVRINYLNAKPFTLHFTKSEDLPSPSLQRERHDLQLEMQLPRDGQMGYNNVSMAIQRQLGYDDDAEADSADSLSGGKGAHAREAFHLGSYFGDLFHAERHHTSSLPYARHDTNNVLGLRLFPLNLHIRLRTEGVRIRTEDLRNRARDAKLCAAHGLPLQSPLPESVKSDLKHLLSSQQGGEQTLYSGAIDSHGFASKSEGEDAPAAKRETETTPARNRNDQALQYLRGGPAHPRPEELTIFTRPQDLAADADDDSDMTSTSQVMRMRTKKPKAASVRAEALRFFSNQNLSADASACSTRSHPQHWMPLQMLKPMHSPWSASMRSSGTRGPSMQLMQERLDQKGFGWKRKSRSLWQMDVDTAGFRPHRYF